MWKMKVLFVDNEIEHIEKVEAVLTGTKLFEVKPLRSYKDLGNKPDQILAAVEPYDLLVLDVYEDDAGAGFKRVVNVVAAHKPLLAYTWSERHEPLGTSSVTVEDWVLEKGGLGVITKQESHQARRGLTDEDMRNRLVERILTFYWTVRTASNSGNVQGTGG